MIPKRDLKHGYYYLGKCRNSDIAVWDSPKNCFWYLRFKFMDVFSEYIKHPEDDDGFDIFIPVREVDRLSQEEIPDNIPIPDHLKKRKK